ncbi:hypothetical protein K435DRAFT_869160 [Dendrothele bispora CBS 962.96]|uniref:Uncharacterized protein n=1 Tax=Dendrothele bispora (strain CBS 962.96) TaxID=1314807 RepID=A0A4S8LB65_DENBC|nr:hypothetical protein K435DRAFT_869160 [Dendrothele bispora CBS 962.96]
MDVDEDMEEPPSRDLESSMPRYSSGSKVASPNSSESSPMVQAPRVFRRPLHPSLLILDESDDDDDNITTSGTGSSRSLHSRSGRCVEKNQTSPRNRSEVTVMKRPGEPWGNSLGAC